MAGGSSLNRRECLALRLSVLEIVSDLAGMGPRTTGQRASTAAAGARADHLWFQVQVALDRAHKLLGFSLLRLDSADAVLEQAWARLREAPNDQTCASTSRGQVLSPARNRTLPGGPQVPWPYCIHREHSPW